MSLATETLNYWNAGHHPNGGIITVARLHDTGVIGPSLDGPYRSYHFTDGSVLMAKGKGKNLAMWIPASNQGELT